MSQPLAAQTYTATPARRTNAERAALHLAMTAYVMAYGFTALRIAITEAESQVARENRELLAREGWIG